MSSPTLKRYYLRSPTGKRISFKIYLQTIKPDGTTHNETIKNADLDGVNQNLQAGVYTHNEARALCEKIRLRLNEELGVIDPYDSAYAKLANPQNQKLLDRYWEAEYSYRFIVDEDAAKNKLKLAVGAIGNISLLSGTRGELTEKVKSLPFDVFKKRQITSSLNQLLKFARRDFSLVLPKKVRRKVKYITPEEFHLVLPNIECRYAKALCQFAFLSGARQSECYAILPDQLRGTQIYIDTQLTEDEERKEPKWGSVRPAYVFEGAAEPLAIIQEGREKGLLPSRDVLRKDFKRACMKAFPGRRDKHLTFHDLRHSYAIHLLSFGVVLNLVAQSLGNSMAVCEEYYTGHVLSEASLDMIATTVRKNKATS